MLKIIFYLAGLVVLALGALPIIKIVYQSQNALKMDYNDEIYFSYHGILAIVILLGSIGAAVMLFWVGRRDKRK